MVNVALFDDFGGPGTSSARLTIPSGHTTLYLGGQFYATSAQLAASAGYTHGSLLYAFTNAFHDDGIDLGGDGSMIGFSDYAVAAGSFTPDTWHTVEMFWDVSAGVVNMALDATSGTDTTGPFASEHFAELDIGCVAGTSEVGQGIYVGKVWIGTTVGSHDLLLEDWSGGTFANWTSTSGAATIVAPPGADPPAFISQLAGGGGGGTVHGRVSIAFDDTPLEPSPTWTIIDQGAAAGVTGPAEFPDNFVSGYDIQVGRQTLLAQTDTGTATVYINDYAEALFDPRNVSSPYFGKLDGRQILLQLYDPVADAWEDQFRGLIDDITWDIDGSAVGADGEPINASIQLDCVDVFDYLAGYGLTPGLDGVTPQTVPSGTAGGPPPAGMEDGVYYATTVGTVDDRLIEIATDVGLDPAMYHFATGNVHVLEVKYDPDESALQAMRDAADAEIPFIANLICDRHGILRFHGRYSRFDPDDVSAEPGSDWDFNRWAVGDGAAITADATRAQMRLLSFGRNRSDLINAGICYPANLPANRWPDQVYADTTSITAYGKHQAAPMSDLLLDKDDTQPSSGYTGAVECFHYIKLLVLNQKDPRENVTSLQVRSIEPTDARAAVTWALITRADISDIINVSVGYPSGTGLAGDSPDDDYYIEGRQMRVRPLRGGNIDYVEVDYNLTPAVWSMDTHGVFPPFS